MALLELALRWCASEATRAHCAENVPGTEQETAEIVAGCNRSPMSEALCHQGDPCQVIPRTPKRRERDSLICQKSASCCLSAFLDSDKSSQLIEAL